jgi:hypothetical protein
LASFEMPRFVAQHTHERIAYFLDSPWLALPGFFLWAVGILQPFAMIGLWFVRKHPRKDWNSVKILILGTFLGIYACFLFTPDMAASFRMVLLIPVIMLYSLYCWDYLAAKPFWRRVGLIFLLSGVYFQIGYTIKNMESQSSVYAKNRGLMTKAIEAKDYRLLAERRPGSLY